MPTTKYRVALVGAAGTWGRYYLRTYAAHPDCEIVALADRARDRRGAFADRYGVAEVYDTVEDLLVREVPDIVSLILPAAYTYGAVIACAEAGVRVVSCEKPIAAELSKADEMVRVCRERGTLLGCGQAAWGTPYMPDAIEWVQAGNIGRITDVAIPGGLPTEMSGGGCVQLAGVRILTGMEVEWVEGWTLPSEPGYVAPPGRPETEADCPAYGRLGLSGGIVCDIVEPQPDRRVACYIAAECEDGQVWFSRPVPVLIQGKGARSTPVHPEFLDAPQPRDFFVPTIERLMRAFDTGEEPLSSGDDFRHSLETAIAIRLSSLRDHERVSLPLEDRSLRLYPHPYRFTGGDEAGWESIGYAGPPGVV